MNIQRDEYQKFLESKMDIVEWRGWETNVKDIHPSTYPHQVDAIKWSTRIGRGLIAMSFGLGKTQIGIELAKMVVNRTGGIFLIVAPLGVRHHFIYKDGPRLGVQFEYVTSDLEIETASTPFLITNYERVRDGNIDPRKHKDLQGVILDEGSVLRSLGSKTYDVFGEVFAKVPYRWVATATPSPNNFKEILGYADFLGIMDRGQALAQPLDAKILTPYGYIQMGLIDVGDEIITVDGKPAKVIGVYPQGIKDIYKVTFSDGSFTKCTQEHLWFTHTGNERRAERRYRLRHPEFDGTYGTVKELSEIMNSLTEHKRGDINHNIPLTSIIQFDHKSVNLDPYLLGCLLGDGHFRETNITFTNADQWIIDEIERILNQDYKGYVKIKYVNHQRKDGQPCYDYSINSGEGRQHNPVLTAIKNYNLIHTRSWDKFIPDDYLYNDKDIRLAILQGLMDTDGTTTNNTPRFVTTSPKLAEDVKFLVQSFGGTATIYENFGTTPSGNRGRMQYRLTIRLPNGINPFRLPRKADLITPREKYQPVRYITNIEFDSFAEAQCIAIDHPQHLYLTDDCIVTHNTRFFQRNVDKAGDLTLIPKEEENFWLWVASWALFIFKPSDLGYPDTGYDMPEIKIHWHRVPMNYQRDFGYDSWGQYRLLPDAGGGIQQAMREKRETIEVRLDKALDIISSEPDDKAWLLWHDLEAERKAIEQSLPEAVTVYGSQKLEVSEQHIVDFSDGKFRILATKPQIAGSGCNFQYHCADAIFLGVGYKFQDIIQAVHRIYRFQQEREVNIHFIYAESEDDVVNTFKRKWQQHDYLVRKMRDIVQKYGLTHWSIETGLKRNIVTLDNRVENNGRLYTAIKSDCVLELFRIVEEMEKL